MNLIDIYRLGVAILFSLSITACAGPSMTDGKMLNRSAESESTSKPIDLVVWDIPSYMGKNYYQIKNDLGKEIENYSLGIEKQEVWFEKKDFELGVTYNIQTMEIIQYFVSPDDPSETTKDIIRLKNVANLKHNDPHYEIEYVKPMNFDDKSLYMGIRVHILK